MQQKDAKTDFLAQFFLCFAAVFRRSHVHDSGVQYHPFRIYPTAAAVPFRHTDHGTFFPGNGTGAAMAPPGLNFFRSKRNAALPAIGQNAVFLCYRFFPGNKAADESKSSVCDLTDRTGIGRSEKIRSSKRRKQNTLAAARILQQNGPMTQSRW